MKDELITFETAKLAKEKGCNLRSIHYYFKHTSDNDKEIHTSSLLDNGLNRDTRIEAPTQSLLQRWLRENKKIEVLIKYAKPLVVGDPIRYEFYLYWDFIWYGHHTYETYEQALEAGLQQALKLIK